MKTVILILISFLNVYAFGQSVTKIKLMNGLTKEPIKEEYIEILSNHDTHEWTGTTDSLGIYTLDYRPLNGVPYQVDVRVSGYKPVRKEIDIFAKGMITIAIYPDRLSMPADEYIHL